MWFRWLSTVHQSHACHSNLWNHYLLHLSRSCKPRPCKIEMRPFHLYGGEISAGGRGLVHIQAWKWMKDCALRDMGYLKMRDTSALKSVALGWRGQRWIDGVGFVSRPIVKPCRQTRRTPTTAVWGCFKSKSWRQVSSVCERHNICQI